MAGAFRLVVKRGTIDGIVTRSDLNEVDPKGWTKFGRRLDGAAG
jgi:hypothetical protein